MSGFLTDWGHRVRVYKSLHRNEPQPAAAIPGAPPAVPGPAGLYGMRLRQLGLTDMDDTRAESFWREVNHHRRARVNRLGRVACRYGADEFGVLLPATPQVEALSVAQRICGGISAWFADHLTGRHRISVSASAGVASLPMEDCSVEALVREASSALQDATRLGGHRVVAPFAGPRRAAGAGAER